MTALVLRASSGVTAICSLLGWPSIAIIISSVKGVQKGCPTGPSIKPVGKAKLTTEHTALFPGATARRSRDC
ncbi:hypothetical protein H0G86_000534 [Trichoderma simmonsii]|uniref:Uncharacterized protein n=1 Tax=Trichoderma simmonsii TaxID=1491479 RepID=A0A8G0L4S3_9HYPO|nr:hypothetical protein H0G86_000534 [Trichoderma simmonsii]